VSDPRLHIFGVRHHGPGSAASLLVALDTFDPQIVLVEGPADADATLAHAGAPGTRPPVAILVYDAQDPARSAFYPFAEFSPEWQAIRWAQMRRRTLRFMDMPFGLSLAALDQAQEKAQATLEQAEHEGKAKEQSDDAETPAAESEPAHQPQAEGEFGDPLTLLAQAAGASDGESWWNALVEQAGSSVEVFSAVAEAMSTLRARVEEERPPSSREAMREAHMRLEIARALKDCDGQVAVVCGAWHVPALAKKVAAKDDKATLKGLRAVKTVATWAPWSEPRLAAESGYGAGVVSPGWYGHLWREFQRRAEVRVGADETPVALAARWHSRIAELLRAEGHLAATASVIEASRLAISLAALRDCATPGLSDMQDAALAVLCHGEDVLLKLIERRLVIGEAIGAVGEGAPQTPLAEDLERWRKKLRMKFSEAPEELTLDLRSEAGLSKSTLLHRLLMIDAPWGHLVESRSGRGTFREIWRLAWTPELAVRLATAVRFGPTLERAAAAAAMDEAQDTRSISRLSALIGLALNADLPDAAEALTHRLQAMSVGGDDVAELMSAAVPLIQTLRYGDARKIPREALSGLVKALSAEICAGLSAAVSGLAADAVARIASAMRDYDAAIPRFEDGYAREAWLTALSVLERSETASPALRGLALRRLYDAQKRDAEETSARLSRALSPGAPPAEAGQWIEGFLEGAAQLLLHDERLLGVIDEWLTNLSEGNFMALLPALRRAVSSFDPMERRRVLETIRRGPRESTATATHGDERVSTAFAAALPLLSIILGLDDE
jgi:hypothetical protein